MTNPRDTIEKLLTYVQTLHIATVSAEQQPHVSYAPYIVSAEGDFCVFISELAQHTRNLLHNNNVSILIIEDEQDTQQIFARTRLHYQCRASRINDSDPQYALLLPIMERQLGETVSVLKQLPDFHLFRFTPQSGNLVIGFGQAYRLKPPNNNEHQKNLSKNLLKWQMTLIK